jgi:uncharacterized delta-60 repeat protein
MLIIRTASVALALTLSGVTFAQPGFVDPSFGGGDVVVPASGVINWVGCQSSGKVVAVRGNGGNSVIRFNLDGTVDSTFSSSGTLPQDPYCYGLLGVSGAVDSSDRILMISGTKVVRLLADGARDNSFGTGGVVALCNGTYNRFWYLGVVMTQTDGKVVVAATGSAQTGNPRNGNDLTLIRLNANGSLDTTFANFGHGSTPGYFVDGLSGAQQAQRHCGFIQPDGKIVVAVWGTDINGYIARFLPTGALDTTFGVGGRRTYSFSGGFDEPTGLALTADGHIMFEARSPSYGSTYFVASYTSAGALDPSFGSGGVVTLTVPANSDFGYGDVKVQSDGGVLVPVSLADGGTDASGNPTKNIGVLRLTSSGAPDAAFGPTGNGVSQMVGPVGVDDGCRAMTVDPFGRIILGCVRAGVGDEVAAIRGQ